jgi:hypothetical protein
MNLKISPPKNMAPKQNFSFVENCPNDVIAFQWRSYP